jgi:hypothetical protein
MPKLPSKLEKEAAEKRHAENQNAEVLFGRAVYFDPGDRYTGVAIFEKDDLDDAWTCTDAFTWDIEEDGSADELQDWITSTTSRGDYDIVGYEVWRLYGDKAQQQKGSEFLATQLIGVIKYIARRNATLNRWPRPPLELVRFLPDFKKATAGILEAHGIASVARAKGTKGDHAWDAELQGYYDLIKNRQWKVKGYAEGRA